MGDKIFFGRKINDRILKINRYNQLNMEQKIIIRIIEGQGCIMGSWEEVVRFGINNILYLVLDFTLLVEFIVLSYFS